MNPARRVGVSMVICGAALALELTAIFALSFSGDFSVRGTVTRFVAIFLVSGFAYLVAITAFKKSATTHGLMLLWVAAISLRIAALFMQPGDDVWRYLWEGKLQNLGTNPYLHAPDDSALEPLRDEVWQKVNHPEFAAIYPPGIEMIFAVISRISRSPFFFKIVFALADLGVVFLLLKLVTGVDSLHAVAWYAWSPTVICSFGGAAHFDSLMLFPLLGGILCLERARREASEPDAWLAAILGAVCLGLAISIKTVPLFLLPICFVALGRRGLTLIISLAIPFCLSLFYGGFAIVAQPVREFAKVARFNDAIWWISEKFIWSNPAQKNGIYNFIIVLVVCALTIIFRRDWRRGILWIIGAMLILSPVLHPWYLTWILPFACLRRQPAWFIYSLTVVLALLVWETAPITGQWTPSPLIRLAELLPPLAIVIFAVHKNRVPVP